MAGFIVFTHTGPEEIESMNSADVSSDHYTPKDQRKVKWYDESFYLHVFVEMDRLIVDVVPHEEIIDTGQKSHLRQGEYVHELFHGMSMRTLQASGFTLCYSAVFTSAVETNTSRD